MRELEYAIICEQGYGGKPLVDRLLGVEWSNAAKDLVEVRGRLCKTADGVVGGVYESSVPVYRLW